MLAAAWLTAVATGLLAILAVVTAIFAIKAFGKQSGQLKLQQLQLEDQRTVNAKQIEVLQLQAQELNSSLEERKREAGERHRAQATRVFIWEDRQTVGNVSAIVKNSSQQPIYDVEIVWYTGSTVCGRDEFEQPLMPDQQRYSTSRMSAPDIKEFAALHADVWFRDAAGTSWRSQPDGNLYEVPHGKEPPREL